MAFVPEILGSYLLDEKFKNQMCALLLQEGRPLKAPFGKYYEKELVEDCLYAYLYTDGNEEETAQEKPALSLHFNTNRYYSFQMLAFKVSPDVMDSMALVALHGYNRVDSFFVDFVTKHIFANIPTGIVIHTQMVALAHWVKIHANDEQYEKNRRIEIKVGEMVSRAFLHRRQKEYRFESIHHLIQEGKYRPKTTYLCGRVVQKGYLKKAGKPLCYNIVVRTEFGDISVIANKDASYLLDVCEGRIIEVEATLSANLAVGEYRSGCLFDA